MKKFTWILVGLIIILGLVFVFSGCGAVKNAVKDLQQDAELASKALSDTGYINLTGVKSISFSNGDVSGSQYADQLGSTPTTFSITFTDQQVTVQDNNGNNIIVTLNGTVSFGWNYTPSQTSFTFKMVEYSTALNVKVSSDDMGSVPVDVLFSFTADLTSTTGKATVEGHVGSYTINTTMSGISVANIPI